MAIEVDHTRSPLEAAPVSQLASLAASLKTVQRRTVRLKVPARPEWDVEYSEGIDGPQLAGWTLACADPNTPDGTDNFLLQRTVLAAQCVAMYHNGVKVTGGDGRPVTFAHTELQEMLGVPAATAVSGIGATEAVRAFYANDFHIASAFDKVLELCGFGQEATEVDPTVRPSSA